MAAPLEDSWSDVLGKALRGRHCSPDLLARGTGMSPEAALALTHGSLHEPDLLRAAGFLGLHGPSLLALARGAYPPGPATLPDGLARFTSDWDGMAVHSYLAWDPASGEAAAFDTGADASELLAFLRDRGLSLRLLLLTPAHGDQVFETDRIVEKTGAEAWIGEGEDLPGVRPFPPGRRFHAGSLAIATRLTRGHSPGGITYVPGGLGAAIVGDALFAGSLGGPKVSYEESLRTTRQEILSLPPDTILCPGHGPLTTVGIERAHNPFFAR